MFLISIATNLNNFMSMFHVGASSHAIMCVWSSHHCVQAALRIDKWLKWKSNCHSPPSLCLPAPPFSMVTREMLLDKDAVLNIVMSDINFITQQAREGQYASSTGL